MNRWVKIFLSVIVILFVLLLLARLTGGLLWFKAPTPSMEPTIRVGQSVFASSFKTPGRGDIIIYKNAYSDSVSSIATGQKRHNDLYMKRLCGIPGDIIEMKAGVLYVNNKNFDELFDMAHYYRMPPGQLASIEEGDVDTESGFNGYRQNDSVYLILLSNSLFKKYHNRIDLKPYAATDSTIWNHTGKNGERETWTIDNFGPLTVPENCFFVLGDNRSNSLDSRYFGFISKTDCKATVLRK